MGNMVIRIYVLSAEVTKQGLIRDHSLLILPPHMPSLIFLAVYNIILGWVNSPL